MKTTIKKIIKKLFPSIVVKFKEISETRYEVENIKHKTDAILNLITNNKCEDNSQPVVINDELRKNFRQRLYTPTFIQKIENLYYIVDCWHHRIIYCDNVERPVISWNILDENLGGPHSIVSNKEYLLTENTGYNSIRIYKTAPGGGGGVLL